MQPNKPKATIFLAETPYTPDKIESVQILRMISLFGRKD